MFTINEKGWNGKKNGDLLDLLSKNAFDVLLTFDRNIRHQQNVSKFKISVLVIMTNDNDYHSVSVVVTKINELLLEKLEFKVYEVHGG